MPSAGFSERSVRARFLLILAAVSVVSAWAFAASAHAAVYSQSQISPVPPASNFAGQSGGDGWDISLSTTRVFNVFHHSGTTTIACHEQANAASCTGWPKTATGPLGVTYATSIAAGTHLDAASGRLYVFGRRLSDSTPGVVCVDTTGSAGGTSASNPFCGFTALGGPGEAVNGGNWPSGISGPALVGTRWYALNAVANTAGGGPQGTGSQNRLLCFDFATGAACAGQPYTLAAGGTTFGTNYDPSVPVAIGTKVIVPLVMDTGNKIACFDTATTSSCAGAWPIASPSSNNATYGGAFPKTDANGAINGFCLPVSTAPCFTLAGASVATPAGMAAAIGQSYSYNGPSVNIGSRVYVPDAFNRLVHCYDYSTSAGCANFPRSFSNLSLLYTVNPDPQRPACLWVNADSGTQIQNFDAYTGGACGAGATRVLTSQFIVPQEQCYPKTYVSLQVVSPAPAGYTSGTVSFVDGGGNPIPGTPAQPLD
ncbi:MAG: hypothetical protein QOF76_1060, partial [Solirubrobacteraceae bacterium]|nr:hypothetical protein [Solirubrobacteraceae bacterium]